MKQTILLTALPLEINGGVPRIGVFVSPRLEPPAPTTLTSFDNFRNWPTTLVSSLTFEVEISGLAGPLKTTRVTPDPDEGTWDSLFKAATPVRSGAPKPLHTRVLRSFPVRNVLTHLQTLYRSIAESSPTGFPVYVPGEDKRANPALVNFINGIGVLGDMRQVGGRTFGRSDLDTAPDTSRGGAEIKRGISEEPLGPTLGKLLYSGKKVIDFDTEYAAMTPEQKKQADFALAYSFHDRPGRQKLPTDAPFAKVVPPELEFHEIVASLASYPAILKRLGLLFELEVNLGGQSMPSSGKMRVRAVFPSAPAYNVASPAQPWINFETSGGAFRAQARPGGDLDDGMVVLADASDRYIDAKNAPYMLSQIDPDGAAMKAVDFAINHRKLLGQVRPYTMPEDAALPALKTAGIGLIRHNRGYNVYQVLQAVAARQVTFVGGGAPDLYLDDILRGYRVDILDESGTWFSLVDRVGYYHFTNPDGAYSGDNPLVITDEGYVRGASAASDIAGGPDLYLHEAVFRWEGWSLVAPRPGKTIVRQESDPNQPPEIPEHRQNSTGGVAHLHMEANFKPTAKSLPRLRYGRKYRVRVRTVDLGGYGPKLSTAPVDAKFLSNALQYSRFEPVSNPFIVLREKVQEGESAERMVIRSNFDKTTTEYTLHAKTTYGSEYNAQNERWLAPPKVAQQTAETHGMFDPLLEAGKVDEAYHLARREEGTFLDVNIVDPTNPNTPIVVTESKILNGPATPAYNPPTQPVRQKVLRASELTDPANQAVWTRGEPLAPGQYVIHPELPLLLPYLPDPIGRGCSIEGLRDVTGNGTIPGGAQKVELPPFNQFDRTYRVVKIPFDGTWPDFKPFRILIRERDGKMEGDNCDETFVDATKPPEWDPATRILTVYLGKAEQMKLRYSTYLDKNDLRLMGIWKWLDGSPKQIDFEPYGVAGVAWMVTPHRELTLVHAVQQPLCEPRIVKYSSTKMLGQTFATFRGNFLLNVASTGRLDVKGEWKEWVDPLSEPGPKQITGSAQVYFADIPETASNNLLIPNGLPKPPEEFRHEFNDTKHRMVDYNLVGTSRFREYFPQSAWADPTNITRVGPPMTQVKILNSARPAMPRILYIVPTFGWQRPTGTTEIVSRRCGGGLRVYLDRPWYSSGDGELLGVVLYTGDTAVPEESPLRPYATQWGMDPVLASFPTYKYTQIGHFKGFETTGMGVTLDEVAGAKVNVVGYIPGYDESRKLWYCDIEIDAGPAYFPFVRLALARFQPNSVVDAHISRVVMTDFAQLAADRAASIVFEANTVLSLYVSGSFGINEATAQSSNKLLGLSMTRVITATLEELDSPSENTLDWRPVGSSGTSTKLTPHYEKEFELKMLWTGRMMLPGTPKRFPGGTKDYRVVITEWEYFDADANRGGAEQVNGRWMNKRLVYADAIKL